MYAVLDLETTGLFTTDRVIEVAVVHADAAGHVTGSWHTLVNPERDLGRQDLHGVRAADARDAPLFAEIAGDVAAHMAGRVPVVHNIGFDARLLRAEYERLGLEIPWLAEYGVCTMSWAAEFLPGTQRSLAACCAALGIANDRPHEALSDALATAEVLQAYLAAAAGPPPWAGLEHTAAAMDWPALPYGVTAVRHRTTATPAAFLDRIPRARTGTAGDPGAYLSLVDRALLDGAVSAAEADGLVEVAAVLRLDRAAVLALHEAYVGRLAAAGAPASAVGEAARELGVPAPVAGAASVRPAADWFSLRPGDVIVLTGSFRESKEYWAHRAAASGYAVAGHVSKRTALVVAADPDSMSGKATRARSYGIPVVGTAGLERFLR